MPAVEVGEGRRQAAEALLDDGDDPPADLAGGLPVEDRGTERLVAQLQRRADHDRERADRRVVGVAAELAREDAAERLAGLVPDQRAPGAEGGRPVLRLLEAPEHLVALRDLESPPRRQVADRDEVLREQGAQGAEHGDRRGGRSVTVDSNRARTSSTRSKKSSSFEPKWLKIVLTDTSAASAISASVTRSKPRSMKSRVATSEISRARRRPLALAQSPAGRRDRRIGWVSVATVRSNVTTPLGKIYNG